MSFFKHIIRRSGILLFLAAMVIYPTIWVFIHLEALLKKSVNWLIKKTIPIFNLQHFWGYKLLRSFSQHLTTDRLTPQIVSRMSQQGLTIPASVTASMILRHTYCDNLILPEWKIYNKIAAYRFAKALGLKTPEVFFENVPFADIRMIPGSVVKPMHESHSNGVFVVKGNDQILELKTGRIFYSWQSFTDYVNKLLDNSKINRDKWMVEQFIMDHQGNIPSDIKFNVFYGTVGWIAEIRRFPKTRYCIYDGSNKIFNSGLYRKYELFTGQGAKQEDIELAKSVSLEIPVPFMRIDFISGHDGLYFGEFTPKPGVIGYLSKDRDQLYGQMFLEAEARLYADLIAGKRFNRFNEYADAFVSEGLL